MTTATITGVIGQDRLTLAKFQIEKDYKVVVVFYMILMGALNFLFRAKARILL